MTNYDEDRLIAADHNDVLYQIIEVLDRYDLGKLGSGQSGEYASEAKKIVNKLRENGEDIEASFLVELIAQQFDFKFKPLSKKAYKNAANEINAVYNSHKDDPIFKLSS